MKKIFIGSSSEALDKARVIEGILNELGAHTTCWASDDAFKLSHNTLDELIQATRMHDAGIFIFDKDDEIVCRSDGTSKFIPRDNVIAEAGMFVSALGQKAVVLCTVPGVHEISDFKGITTLCYDLANFERLKNKLKIWLDEIRENRNNNNVLMLPRHEIHRRYSLDSRLHVSDGIYKSISKIRIMNFASNLLLNPVLGEIGHIPMNDLGLSEAIEKIMRETNANVELILSKPTIYNLRDLETKIANKRAGSSEGALYSALATLYKNLTDNTIFAERNTVMPILFKLYVSKISIPFGIFNVEFLGKESRWNHVKVDLYSAGLNNEDDRRSFIIWQENDSKNYDFFIHNFDNIKRDSRICEVPTLNMLKEWADIWESLKK